MTGVGGRVAAGGVEAARPLARFEVAIQSGQFLAFRLDLVDLGLEPVEFLLGFLLGCRAFLQHFPEKGAFLVQGGLLLASSVGLLRSTSNWAFSLSVRTSSL